MNHQSAILVDGDNISAAYAEAVLKLCAPPDKATVIRVYGDAAKPSGWRHAHDFRFIHAGTGKNATDILLVIQAMELALSVGYRTFVLASSDGDFTHLAVRLRELGCRVIGAGQKKAPAAFRAACTSFIELEDIPDPAPSATTPRPRKDIPSLDHNIRDVIKANSKNGQGMRIADLNPIMRAKHGTLISEMPEKSWRAYLTKRNALYELDPKGPDAKVRFKPAGFS